MQWQGSRDIPIAELVYNRQDIAERQQTARVAELAASMRRLGGEPIQPLTVQDVTNLLIAGRDRLAACLMLKLETVPCRVADEFTARELLEVEVEENVRRRVDDRDLLLSRLVEETTKEKASKSPGKSEAPRKGRPVTPKGEARVEVAKLAGTTPEAVRRAETRAAAKTEPPKPAAAPPPIRDFGLGVSKELVEQVERVSGSLKAAAASMVRAQSAYAAAIDAIGGLNREEMSRKDYDEVSADAARQKDQAHRLADKLRSLVPVALCAFCKDRLAVGVAGGVCPFCGVQGYMTAAQAASPIPAELLREGADAMVSNGKGGFQKFDVSTNGGLDRKAAATTPVRTPSRAPASKPSAARLEPRATKGAAAVSAGDGANHATHPSSGVTQENPPPPTSHTEGMGPADVAPTPRASKPPRRMHVQMPDGFDADPTNPDDVARYSGDDAPVQDVPELVVEPDEAVEWSDDDGQGAA